MNDKILSSTGRSTRLRIVHGKPKVYRGKVWLNVLQLVAIGVLYGLILYVLFRRW